MSKQCPEAVVVVERLYREEEKSECDDEKEDRADLLRFI
jgi:hypothetical protein